MTVPEILSIAADSTALEALDSDTLKQNIVFLVGHYAGSPDPALVPTLLALYQRWAAQSDPTERLGVLEDATRLAEDQRGVPYRVLMPFITAETDHVVISTAALNLASIAPGDDKQDGDDYAGASWLAGRLLGKERLGETDGSVLAGLLLLGDRRVLPSARALWQRLPPEGRHRVARAQSGMINRPHLEFLLWALEDEVDEVIFGALAAAVLNLSVWGDTVVEIIRHLPVWDAPDPEQPIELLSQQSLRETGEALRPQMEALIAAEPGEEKILPRAFAPWLGLDGEADTANATSSPEERARRVGKGGCQADWKGKLFTDTASYWHADEPLCQLALVTQMTDLNTHEDVNADTDTNHEKTGRTFPRAFPFYRESIEFGLPGNERNHWLGLATLAGFGFVRAEAFDSNDESIRHELSDASAYTTCLIHFLDQQEPGVGMLGHFYQALHQALGLDLGEEPSADRLYGVADRALWLGASVALSKETAAIAWLEAASRNTTLGQRAIVESLSEADAAQTTGELMIPALLKLCQRKYAAGTVEAECFGTYYQEALASGELSQVDRPERWYADAYAFASVLFTEHSDMGRALLTEFTECGPSTISQVRQICERSCGGAGVKVTEAIALQAAQQFVEKEMGYQRAPSTSLWNLDRIIHGVDLILWAVMLEAFPDF